MIITSSVMGCCGLSGAIGFNSSSEDRIERYRGQIRRWKQEAFGRKNCQTLQANLTNAQISRNKGALGKMLSEEGFKLVHRWTNINSGAQCNMFVLSLSPTKIRPQGFTGKDTTPDES